jgi:uncharacterized membrane protein (DUF106 family)
MTFARILSYSLRVFSLVVIVSAIVTYLYSLIVHGSGIIDWETSFRLAIIFAIVLPTLREVERKEAMRK